MYFKPWLDFEHHHYWVAEADSNIVAILVLTKIHHNLKQPEYQIKNAVSFPNAPRGASEMITMSDIQDEGVSTDDSDRSQKMEGMSVWTKKDVDVAHKIKENSSHHQHEHHSHSQSVCSHRSDSSESFSGKSSPAAGTSGYASFLSPFLSDK